MKSCIILVELSEESGEGDMQLVEFFQALFDSVTYVSQMTRTFDALTALCRAEHSAKIIEFVVDVMHSCLDECEYITHPMLDCILARLLPANKVRLAIDSPASP